jgi:lactate permease
LDTLLATLPILLILVLMLGLRWNAARAGTAGWALALLIAIVVFGSGAQLLGLAHIKAILLTLDVLLIIWNAFLLYRVTEAAGAIQMLSNTIPRITSDQGMQALLIGWAFASFLQGVGGFGVPTAVTAPLLVGLGFHPVAAVAIPSLGHAWSVTFGSLASSFQALQSATDLSWQVLAPASAIFLAIACLACGYVVAHLADGWSSVRRHSLHILVMATAMGGSQYLLAVSGMWTIAGLGGGTMGLVAGLLISASQKSDKDSEPPIKLDRELLLAMLGYIALVVFTLILRNPAVYERLDMLAIRVQFPQLTTRLGFTTPAGYGRQIYLLRHAGSILALSSAFTYWLYRRAGLLKTGSGREILLSTIKRMAPSSFGILMLVSMAVIMNHAGMTETIANGIAVGVGTLYPFASPFIGALGAFMTGSNTNSNVVFAQLQLRTAQVIGLSAPIILAAQTTGGALGSVIAPAKIIVGTATAGLKGHEGHVLHRMAGYTFLLVGLIGILTWFALAIKL